jgi:hypothetical protein
MQWAKIFFFKVMFDKNPYFPETKTIKIDLILGFVFARKLFWSNHDYW